MTLTLTVALTRILESTATNEGPDAMCSFSKSPNDPPRRVADLVRIAPIIHGGPVTLRRTVRNWSIHMEDGTEIYRAHPWDDTPNVAKLGVRPDPAHIESLVQFNSRLQELANEAERLRQFVIAQNLWQIAAVVADYTGQPSVNAISEARRLGEVAAALQDQSRGKKG